MNDQDEVPVGRAAIVTAGVVDNIIVVSLPQEGADPFVLEGSEIVLVANDSEVSFGWLWDGVEFHAPPNPEE